MISLKTSHPPTGESGKNHVTHEVQQWKEFFPKLCGFNVSIPVLFIFPVKFLNFVCFPCKRLYNPVTADIFLYSGIQPRKLLANGLHRGQDHLPEPGGDHECDGSQQKNAQSKKDVDFKHHPDGKGQSDYTLDKLRNDMGHRMPDSIHISSFGPLYLRFGLCL